MELTPLTRTPTVRKKNDVLGSPVGSVVHRVVVFHPAVDQIKSSASIRDRVYGRSR
jgi:hypothetical protein